jgi:hypothetical protein
MSTERKPGYYWIQYRPNLNLTIAYYRGIIDDAKIWIIGSAMWMSEQNIFSISDELVTPDEICLKVNKDYTPYDIII